MEIITSSPEKQAHAIDTVVNVLNSQEGNSNRLTLESIRKISEMKAN